MNEEEMILIEGLADEDQLKEWKQKAQELNIPLNYYIAEFV
jgi:hypothetical protein